jgi:hypothetical protein
VVLEVVVLGLWLVILSGVSEIGVTIVYFPLAMAAV